MRYYLIDPQEEKSIVKREFFSYYNDEKSKEYVLEIKTGWRWGSFMISIPETQEEIKNFLEKSNADSRTKFIKSAGTLTLEQALLPHKNYDTIPLTKKYNAKVQEIDDFCWIDFYIQEGHLSSDEQTDIIKEVQSAYEKNGYTALADLGWYRENEDFELIGAHTTTECDVNGKPL